MTWPKIFHRIWLDEPESPRFADYRVKLEALHPDWEVWTWSDSTELGWLEHGSEFFDALKRDPFGRAPDILRYELLWRFGGIYIDTDFDPLKAFDPLLEDDRPFGCWENERTMCTAMLAAPPKHPAVGALMDGLSERLASTWEKPANYAVGPEYATPIWRARDDVRRLPPSAFYPVGWWEKDRLDEPYPAETYAVHQWAKGWG